MLWNLITQISKLPQKTVRLHGQYALIKIVKDDVFHPINSLIEEEAYILICKLSSEIQDLQMEEEFISDMTFLSMPQIHSNQEEKSFLVQFKNLIPILSSFQLNGDLWKSIKEDEAREFLNKIARERSFKDAEDCLLPIIISLENGYIGQGINENKYFHIRIEKRDDYSQSYDLSGLIQEFICDRNEVTQEILEKKKLKMHANAVFNIYGTSINFGLGNNQEPCIQILSSWDGIHHIPRLLCHPPPLCSSILLLDVARIASIGDGVAGMDDPFLKNLSTSVSMLEKLEKLMRNESINNLDSLWPNVIRYANWETEVRNFVSSSSLNTTGTQERSNLDFAELLWCFLLKASCPTDLLSAIIQVCFFISKGIVVPSIHNENKSKLGCCFQKGADLLNKYRYADSQDSDPFLKEIEKWIQQTKELEPSFVFQAICELGIWKVKRDMKYWFAEKGTVYVSQVLSYFDDEQIDDQLSVKSLSYAFQRIKQLQNLIFLIAVSSLMEISPSSIYILLNQALSYYKAKVLKIPHLKLKLETSIPELLRSSMSDPYIWELELDTGEPSLKRSFVSMPLSSIVFSNSSSSFAIRKVTLDLLLEDSRSEKISDKINSFKILPHDYAQEKRALFQLTRRNIVLP